MLNTHVHYRIDQVARTLNCKIPDVYRLLGAGELEGIRCRQATRVTAESMRSYLERTGPFPAPPETEVPCEATCSRKSDEAPVAGRLARRFTLAASTASRPNRRAA